MPAKPWRLPWHLGSAPHALLDIIRGCNITCGACYASSPDNLKPFAQIENELNQLIRLRPLQSVSVIGGEVTLHPDLCKVISLAKSKGLTAHVFTNGVLLDSPLLSALKRAGTDNICLHIDAHQRRPDLPEPFSVADLNNLREEKARLISEHDIDASLAITAFPDSPDEVLESVRFVLASPYFSFLLVTLYRAQAELGELTGNLQSGIRALKPGSQQDPPPGWNIAQFETFLRERFALEPFAFVGSNLDPNTPRWLSYLVGSVFSLKGGTRYASLHPSFSEKAFLLLSRTLSGRYPFYVKTTPALLRLQLLLNALTGGKTKSAAALLCDSLRPGNRIRLKRLLFQSPAELTKDGTLIHCACCPDAVLKNGGLVPVCVVDRVADP